MCNALKDHVAKVEENIHRGELCTYLACFYFSFEAVAQERTPASCPVLEVVQSNF